MYVGEPIIGYRRWGIDYTRNILLGNVVHSIWPHDKAFEAECVKKVEDEKYPARGNVFHSPQEGCPPIHDAPEMLCSCGIYGYYKHVELPVPSRVTHNSIHPMQVYGAVIAWGNIVAHEIGFRAQYVKPVAFAAPMFTFGEGNRDMFDHVARKYQVELVDRDDLTEVASTMALCLTSTPICDTLVVQHWRIV